MLPSPLFWPISRSVKLAAAALVMLALQSCGRYGPLEPPETAANANNPENRHDLDLHRANQPITPPKKDFMLDPLLQ